MSWQDRDYYQGEAHGLSGRERMWSASAVAWLIGINVVIFLLVGMTGGANSVLFDIGYFDLDRSIMGLQLWRIVSYQYLHDPDGLGHIVFNMLILYFFGKRIEHALGRRRFIVFYTLCGIGGALLYVLLALSKVLITAPDIPLVGASGCLFGILVAAAVLFPHHRVMLLFPPIPMTVRTMALLFLAIAAGTVIFAGHNAGGEAAHLGGAAAGFLFVHNARWLDVGAGWKLSRSRGNWKKKQEEQQVTQEAIDRILEKVHDKGLASLSSWEKRQLRRATERHQQRHP